MIKLRILTYLLSLVTQALEVDNQLQMIPQQS